MKTVTVVLLVLYISGLLIAGNYNLHLINSNERFEFGKLYYAWMLKTGKNIGAITGNAIKLDWKPELLLGGNISSSNKTK